MVNFGETTSPELEQHNPLYEAQLLTYLKLTKNKLGLLINFNVTLFKEGIKRVIL